MERGILPGFLLCLLVFFCVPGADGQFETSQVPVQATVSYEPVKMQADAPRRLQLSRTNITTSRYKSERLDYLHTRTPAITISRFSTINLASLPGRSAYTNWNRF
jgi:hypothetical protein